MIDIAIRAARAAGQIMAERYNKPHEVSVKGLRDIVTDADLACEEAAVQVILQEAPESVLVTEESFHAQTNNGSSPTWYIDPIDGTTNFARGLPMFCVSVAMGVHGQIQCGVIYDPLLDHLFSAERGKGAFLNGQRLSVSDTKEMIDSVILLDWPRDQKLRETSARFVSRLAGRVDTIRSRGSAAEAICYVAAGWCEAYFQYTLSPWDVAAASLIAEEAGAQITDLHAQPCTLDSPSWLVSNGQVHERILSFEPFQE